MQSAKDTFYLTLRNRLAALNPSRTVVVRGGVRPAVIVAENELVNQTNNLQNAFVLVWQGIAVDATEPMPLHRIACSIQYGTRGTQELDGMDRGRVLDAMDGELRAMLRPQRAAKQSITAAGSSTMQTNIFWSAAQWGEASLQDGGLSRTVALTVCALQEEGDA